MGFFRSLTNSSFKLDSNGNQLFYPWGILGKGYILPSKEVENKIRKSLTAYHVISLLFIIIIGVFLNLWLLIIVMIPFPFIIWGIQSQGYIKGLKESSEKLTLKDNLKNKVTKSKN